MVTVPFRLADIFSPDPAVFLLLLERRSSVCFFSVVCPFHDPLSRPRYQLFLNLRRHTTRAPESTGVHGTISVARRSSFPVSTFAAVDPLYLLCSTANNTRGTEWEVEGQRGRKRPREFVSIARLTHKLSQEFSFWSYSPVSVRRPRSVSFQARTRVHGALCPRPAHVLGTLNSRTTTPRSGAAIKIPRFTRCRVSAQRKRATSPLR